jgi:hypothetical protein
MLVSAHEKSLSEEWATLTSRTELPVSWDVYVRGREEPLVPQSKRRFARATLRTIAILKHGESVHAVYTKDLSRLGIGFLAPLNLLPRQQIRLSLPSRRDLPMRVTRCRRLGPRCFECGATFDVASSVPAK